MHTSIFRSGNIKSKLWRLARYARLKPFDTTTEKGRSEERYRRIVLATISGLLARFCTVIVNLVTVPVSLAYLGKEYYGLWSAITSLVVWVSLFDFGVAKGLVNSIAEAYGTDNDEAASQFVSTAFFTLAGIATICGLSFACIVPFIDWALVIGVSDAVDRTLVMWSVTAAISSVLIGVPLSIVQQIYAGYQKMYVASVFTAFGALATLVGLLIGIRLGRDLPALIFLFSTASHIISLVSLAYVTTIEMPWLRLRLSRFSIQALRRLSATSIPLFLFQLGALLVNETQILILTHRTSLTVVAEYSIIMRLYLVLISMVALGTSAFTPSFREAFERGEGQWARVNFQRMVVLRMSLASAVLVTMIVGGNWIINIWIRQPAIQFDLQVWLALGVLMLGATWVTSFSDLLTIMDRIWVQVPLVLMNGILTSILTYWLAPVLGVLGIILATSAASVLILSWLLPLLTKPLFTKQPS